MPDQLTPAEFAARIKQRDTRLASVPDDVLVKKVLERRPDLITFMASGPVNAKPPAGSGEGPIAQGLTTFERRAFADPVDAVVAGAKRPAFTDVGMKSLDKMGVVNNPIATDEGSLPMNVGATAANLMPFALSGEGVTKSPLGKTASTAVSKGIGAPVRIAAQELAGAGREPVLQEAIRSRVDTAEAAATHSRRIAEVRQQEAAQQAQLKYGDQLKQNLQQTYQRAKGKLDARWNSMRTTPTKSGGGLSILKDEVGNAKDLRDGMQVAEDKFLQGSPDSLKQFRDLTGWIERDSPGLGGEDSAGGVKKGLKPPTWDELRTHYSAMGNAMYGREIPSNVFRALQYVRNDVIGEQLNTMAEKAGVGDQYKSLLGDHSQFEDDWHNMSSVTRGGGSPLAVARMAPNAATLIPQLTGKTGDLLIERLAKYQDAGASPATAEAIRKLGSVKVPKEPSSPGPARSVDPVSIRRSKLLSRASKPPSWWDILFPPTGIEHLALKNPSFREWVATQRRNELPLPKEP